MDNAFSAGNVIVYVVIAVVALVFQWWLLVWAIRRALRDHAIWQYTTWPDMKKAIDEGRLDDRGNPTKKTRPSGTDRNPEDDTGDA